VVWYNEIYITFIFFDDTHTFDFCKFYENANIRSVYDVIATVA
jgi:hypothetical protein